MSFMDSIYLAPGPDFTWRAYISAEKPQPDAALLTAEHDYPVEVFYTRTDLNGSTIYELETCQSREELLNHLTWIGKCRYSLSQIWDFDENQEHSKAIDRILDDSYKRRMEIIVKESEEMFSDSDVEAKDANSVSLANKIDGAKERHIAQFANSSFTGISLANDKQH